MRRATYALAVAALTAGLPASQRGAPPPDQAAPPVEGTAALSGVVMDGNAGRPLAGATVLLQGGALARGGAAGPQRRITDDLGRFVFSKLPAADSYTLSANKLGYFAGRFGEDRPGPGFGQRIVLAEGQWVADARLTLWRPGVISGRVIDEAGEPVVDVLVRVMAQVLIAGRPHLAVGPVDRTDDRGEYRIAGLDPGRYYVSVPSVQATVPSDTPGYLLAGQTAETAASMEASGIGVPVPDISMLAIDPTHRLVLSQFPLPAPSGSRPSAYPAVFFPASRTIADAETVDVSLGQVRQGIDLRLLPMPSVRIAGTMEAAPGATAAGLTLRLLPLGAESLGLGSEAGTALVAANGSFTFLNVPAGEYTIVASRSTMEYATRTNMSMYAIPPPPGFGGMMTGSGLILSASNGARYQFMNGRGPAAFSGRVRVSVGDRDLTGVVVPFRRAVSLSGRVVWEQAGAASSAGQRFVVAHAEPANGDASLGMPSSQVVTNESGSFVVEGLLAGEYVLRFVGATAWVKSITWEGRDYTHRPFDASSGQDITSVVVTFTDQFPQLSGTVRTAQGPAPDRAVVVCFPVERAQWSGYGFRPARIATAAAARGGTYRHNALPAGDYHVIALDPSQAEAWQDPRFLEAAAALSTRASLEWGQTLTLHLVVQQVRVR